RADAKGGALARVGSELTGDADRGDDGQAEDGRLARVVEAVALTFGVLKVQHVEDVEVGAQDPGVKHPLLVHAKVELAEGGVARRVGGAIDGAIAVILDV